MRIDLKPQIRFVAAVLLILILIAGGTAGYMLIEGWSISESLYMTFITISTVGFAEVQPLSPAGRHFTIIFLIFGIATFGYSISTVFSFFFEGQVVQSLRDRRMNIFIDRLKDHYIICGCGDIGREVATELRQAGRKFVVIDQKPEDSELARDSSVHIIKGNAIDEEVLTEAKIERAEGLIAALPTDEANVFVVLTARQLNPSLKIVSKAAEQSTVKKLMKAGANRVISPKEIAGRRMAALILHPAVVNFLDIMVGGDATAVRIEEVEVLNESPFLGKTLKDIGVGQHTGAIVIGIQDSGGRPRIDPDTAKMLAAVPLHEGDTLFVLGNENQISRLREFMKKGK